MNNCSSEIKIALWQRSKAILGNSQTVFGSRIQRSLLRLLKRTNMIEEIQEMYPHIPIQNIEQA